MQPVSDAVLVGLVSSAGLLIANLVVGYIQFKRMLSQNTADDAGAATAYAQLNRELRDEMSKMEVRIQDLEKFRSGPYRITTDIVLAPDPRILRNEIVLMQTDPVVTPGSPQQAMKG